MQVGWDVDALGNSSDAVAAASSSPTGGRTKYDPNLILSDSYTVQILYGPGPMTQTGIHSKKLSVHL